MREPPSDLTHEQLRATLTTDYGLALTELTFLPLGHDSAAWVYKATATDADWFVKVRKAVANEAALVVPHYLADAGVEHVVAPRAARSGALWATAGKYAVIVYPFISERTGLMHGMSDAQWVEYGATLRHIHETAVSPELRDVMRVELFRPDGAPAVRELDAYISERSFEDSGPNTIAGFWRDRRATIRLLLERAVELGERLEATRPRLVLCHADIHTNNVLVAGDEHAWIADWDETMLAPRERDLMFVIGGIGPGFVTNRQERLFFDGYGTVAIDQVALAYYRYAWALSDIGSYGEQVFHRPDLGALDRQEAVDRFQSLFARGSIVDIALGSRHRA